jgi:NAD(P)-dependent dehydrogenase (short-subunit alcohol dehydrogenase family)
MISRPYFLVSGATGGIGTQLCRLLMAAGFRPVVGYRTNKDIASALANECAGFPLRIDLGDESSIEQAVDELSIKLGNNEFLDGLVIAASPPPELVPFGRLRSEMLLNQFQVNVVGPQILLSRLISKFFRRRKRGTVIGVLSKAIGDECNIPVAGMGAYLIAKASMRSMLAIAAVENPWLKVRTVSPGFTRTPMLDVFDSRYLEVAFRQQKVMEPVEVAQLILESIQS